MKHEKFILELKLICVIKIDRILIKKKHNLLCKFNKQLK